MIFDAYLYPPGAVMESPISLNGTVVGLVTAQYVTGSGAEIQALEGLPVVPLFVLFRPSAGFTDAGFAAALSQQSTYLASAKITAIRAARGLVLAMGWQWSWAYDNLFGYWTLAADEAAQIALWVTLLGTPANVSKGPWT